MGLLPHDDDDIRLATYADALADAIDEAIEGWVVRSVEQRLLAWQGDGTSIDAALRNQARVAGEQARDEIGTQVRTLLDTDIDDQRITPLTLLRRAVRYPTAVLRDAGVPPVVRDEFAEASFPDDTYGLTPATFADVDPSLHEPGLAWGAAKAFVHLARRRAEGKRLGKQ